MIDLPGSPVGIALGGSYANLPVSGCDSLQTRSSLAAFHVGVRAPVAVRDGLWFVFRGGVHVGGGIGHSSVASRQACAEQGLAESGLQFGARLQGDSGSAGRISYSTLGWTGGLIDFGPDLDASVYLRLPGRGEHVGLGFFFRHDQLFTDIKPDQYHFKSDLETSTGLATTELNFFDPRVSMARTQLGFRATLMF